VYSFSNNFSKGHAMNMKNSSDTVDKARHALCDRIAQLVSEGHPHIRLRQFAAPKHLGFYTHSGNQWHKDEHEIRDAEVVDTIIGELSSLCSRPHTAGCEVREHVKPDWHDVDIRFDGEALKEHAKNINSYLYGLLFYDHRDSAKDIREKVRRGPRFDAKR
jgi:hypothetical protein